MSITIYDPFERRFRPATCGDCGKSRPITIYDHYGLCEHVERGVKCREFGCFKESDDMACEDFLKVI